MSDEQQKEWMDLYRIALLEVDPAKLQERVEAAQRVIEQRLRDVMRNNGSSMERQALADALQNLHVLSNAKQTDIVVMQPSGAVSHNTARQPRRDR